LNAGVRTLKQGMQQLGAQLQIDIGFMFKQQGAFENGIDGLRPTDPLMASYLQHSRVWSERLVKARNDVEHDGWMLPRVKYSESPTGVKAAEPEIAGQPVTQFVEFMLDRLCCFVEEFTAHCLQRLLPAEVTFTEIPLVERLTEAPERFTVTLVAGGRRRWNIAYHTSPFEET
jgi:hypothetical protein